MHQLEKHIEQTIERLRLLRRSSPVLVALSGGADSVALLSILVSLGYNCIAAHCNFHLRGEESNRDMRHAREVAERLGVDIYIREFDVHGRMRETGESVEMACRELRYAWFHELLDRDYSQAIAVAHHREDNVETFFINLLRSTGLAGLTGMDFRRGFVVRPMLDVSREQIEDYLRDKDIDFVTDSSNIQNDFTRNKIRNLVMPAVEAQFPGAINAILATMDHLREARELLSYSVASLSGEVSPNDETVHVDRLISIHGENVGRYLLFELVKKRGLNASQVNDILRAVRESSTGLRFDIDDNRFAELDRGVLTFHHTGSLPSDSVHTVSLRRDILAPVHIQITPHNIVEFLPARDVTTMYLDSSVLEGNPTFLLRHPRVGDRIKPFGMTGYKLVSDILKDAKFSSGQKRNTWLLVRDETVLWVVGVRASAHFALTPESKHYLQLRVVDV